MKTLATRWAHPPCWSQNWLFEILSLAETQPERVPASLLRRLHALLGELRSHAQPQVRRCFLTLVDRLLHLQKAQVWEQKWLDSNSFSCATDSADSISRSCVNPRYAVLMLHFTLVHNTIFLLSIALHPSSSIDFFMLPVNCACNQKSVFVNGF